MNTVILSGPMIKYPYGGMTQWVMAWLAGLKKLGFDLYYVEDVEWDYACYDIRQQIMTDDPGYGISMVRPELEKYGLQDKWCFLDSKGRFHGIRENEMRELFKKADIFIDLEYNSWQPYSADVPLRVFIDGEPGWNQIGMQKLVNEGKEIAKYDQYFTCGQNIGTNKSDAPTVGIVWKHTLNPVLLDEPYEKEIRMDAPFTTVMKWQANKTIDFNGKTYGMKDVEFSKFLKLPLLVGEKMQIAASGRGIPYDLLEKNGWTIRDGDVTSITVDSYRNYIASSKGEFSVAKNSFIETKNGWFSERSGYYLFSNRPIVVQDTGFSGHIPTGRGILAIRNLEEAVEAIKMINMDYKNHARWAREIVHEYFDAEKVAKNFISKL